MKKEDTVLAGFHAVSSRMKRDSSSIRIVYYDPKRRDQRMRRMIEEIEKAGIRLMQADNNRLDGFSHEVPHQGLIALAAPISTVSAVFTRQCKYEGEVAAVANSLSILIGIGVLVVLLMLFV